jgi:hypothetical protein
MNSKDAATAEMPENTRMRREDKSNQQLVIKLHQPASNQHPATYYPVTLKIPSLLLSLTINQLQIPAQSDVLLMYPE